MKKSIIWKSRITICSLFVMHAFAFAVNDHVQDLPAMGWNSWNYYACNINESTILAAANAIHKKSTTANWEGLYVSMQDVGYKFVNLDDCWEGSRTNGILQYSSTLFPHGFVWLCDSIRRMGLIPGLYTSAGTATCQGRPAQFGYDTADALQYARWGFQYLKEDWCNVPSNFTNRDGAIQLYARSYKALRYAAETAFKEGRYPGATAPKYFTFSLCNWGSYSSWTYSAPLGHSARMSGDISGSWGSVVGIIDQCINNNVVTYNQAGFFNDPDMLEVGNGGMTTSENQAHFDLWCQMQSPLLTGNNIAGMNTTIFNILTNREVIAINQDSLNWGGRRVKNGTPEIWYKRCFTRALGMTGSVVTDSTRMKKSIILFNRGTGSVNYSILRSDPLELGTGSFQVRDLWQHKIIDTLEAAMTSLPAIAVAGHGTTHLLFTPLSITSLANSMVADTRYLSSVGLINGRRSAQGLEIYLPICGIVTLLDPQGSKIATISADGNKKWYLVQSNCRTSEALIAKINSQGRILAQTIVVSK
jgi:alpha-galactosidase